MRKLVYTAFLAAVILSFGCAITNYTLMTDSAGPWGNAVADSYYEKAYVIPSSQIATIWSNGTDELYTLVSQSSRGDRRLSTKNNFDPSGVVTFLDQTYCDPNFQTGCNIVRSWDPDYPDAYPFGSQNGNPQLSDDPFDGAFDTSCPGYRSLSILLSQGTRIGECGSGVFGDKQAAAMEFSLLERGEWRNRAVYFVPMNASNAEFQLTGADGYTFNMPIYGTYSAVLDESLRMAVEITPNMEYQIRALENFVRDHGTAVDMDVTYGSLTVNWKGDILPTGLSNWRDRL